MERVQRRLIRRGGALLSAGAMLALAACTANDPDTKIRIGGGVSVSIDAVSSSGVLANNPRK